jgi:H+-transporting ATPase
MNSSSDPSPQPEAPPPTPEQILGKLKVDPQKGLSAGEAASRLSHYGPNALEESKVSPWKQFLGYFWGPLPWMVEAPAIMALIIQDWVDFAIITFMLVFNAVLGFWEERTASSALDSLKNSLALKARALRDGAWAGLAAKDLVPGDIVRVFFPSTNTVL